MLGKRITIEIEVNTDAVPGWGYNPGDFDMQEALLMHVSSLVVR